MSAPSHNASVVKVISAPAAEPVAIIHQPGTILQTVTLADGALVVLRAAQPLDTERLERMFFRLSARTIYRWFFVGAPLLPHWAARFAQVARMGAAGSAAVVALVGAEIVGAARFDPDAPGDAEVGLVLEDAWQGRGLGRLLLQRMATEALRRHICTFSARTLGENQRALRLFKGTFTDTCVRFAEGEYAMGATLIPMYIGAMPHPSHAA